ncbi:Cyclin [Neofusicoccum parvum]|uniref:RNA polymerase II holoenzyme cyclin-like subunit n=1 Tax=Botryosphaeria parva (strain UCR-NP2) TaxID=1287680 RepID=R1EFE2_BOTPV|nr:putative cyclin protein [Neofusicoccum parvum UCRNP2]GME46307.1 Cyclin [Neofusicoccum parvum]
MHLTEDEVYRSSTQYRLWSFTPERLRSLRESTNANAAERVKANIKRFRQAKSADDAAQNGASNGADGLDIDPLSPDEELKLVTRICKTCVDFADFAKKNTKFNFPTNVVVSPPPRPPDLSPPLTPSCAKATAVQYVKRFYLFNSIMVYDPKKIMPTCLFLATKTEIHWTPAGELAPLMGKGMTADDILAPEYLVAQALRFTFDIRHPYRGLNGGHMELIALAKGENVLLPGSGRTPQEAQAEMLKLPDKPNGPPTSNDERTMTNRIGMAYNTARNTLKSVAPISDAYFFYTPAQIWLAALLLADEPLALFYVDTKFPNSAPQDNGPAAQLRNKLVATLRACAKVLEDQRRELEGPELAEDCKRIARKRDMCSDPEKADLIGLHAAQKRGGAVDGTLEEGIAKRRKLEREQSQKQADEFWGPELKKE